LIVILVSFLCAILFSYLFRVGLSCAMISRFRSGLLRGLIC
jgi:hypothetical protein